MPRILAVDDEPEVLESVSDVLEDSGLDVTTAHSGEEALELLATSQFDVAVLDIIMPGIDGIEVCRRIRANPSIARIPIIFLTAKGNSRDVARGLDAGGDDYLVKPFDVLELPARIRALVRRAPGGKLDTESEYLSYHKLEVHSVRPEARISGQNITLTPTEHRLLHYLMLNSEQPVSIDRMLEDIWEYPPGVGDPQLVRVHINNLRSKLKEAAPASDYIHNLHGRGYMISK